MLITKDWWNHWVWCQAHSQVHLNSQYWSCMLPLPSVPLPSASANFISPSTVRDFKGKESRSQFLWFDLFLNRTNTPKLKSTWNHLCLRQSPRVTLLQGAGSGLPQSQLQSCETSCKTTTVAFEGLAGTHGNPFKSWDGNTTGPEHGPTLNGRPWSTRKIFNKFAAKSLEARRWKLRWKGPPPHLCVDLFFAKNWFSQAYSWWAISSFTHQSLIPSYHLWWHQSMLSWAPGSVRNWTTSPMFPPEDFLDNTTLPTAPHNTRERSVSTRWRYETPWLMRAFPSRCRVAFSPC